MNTQMIAHGQRNTCRTNTKGKGLYLRIGRDKVRA
jgi:hypothetical protein